MSHFSHSANPIVSGTSASIPPTKNALYMANAFVQLYKNTGDTTVRCRRGSALFIKDSTQSISHITEVIDNNRQKLISYISHHYSDEYKSTPIYAKERDYWIHCPISNILYALSTEHSNCLHVLTFMKSNPLLSIPDMIQWKQSTISRKIYSGEPCDPSRPSPVIVDVPVLSQKEKKNILYSYSPNVPDTKHPKIDNPTPADIYAHHYDGVIGGADY